MKYARKKDKRPVNFAHKAFIKCKKNLASAAPTAHLASNVHCKIRLCEEASDFAAGAALEQFAGGRWQPLAFFLKKFLSAQAKYSTYDRQSTAIYLVIIHLS